MTATRRVGPVAAYVLHHVAYGDSGRIVEILTRDHGRFSVFAHGIRRPKSGLAAVLQPFRRLLVSWTGRGDAPTLAGAEIDLAGTPLAARQFMNGCYVNELILKLTTRHDSHPELFDLYEDTLGGLGSGDQPVRALRLFEKRLLDMLGFGLRLPLTAEERSAIDPAGHYHFRPQVGAVATAAGEGGRVYSGAALLALARESIADAAQLQEVKPLLRAALDACLEGRVLRTREVAIAVRRARRTSAGH